eukprot:979103-Amphidinium_carterae.6
MSCVRRCTKSKHRLRSVRPSDPSIEKGRTDSHENKTAPLSEAPYARHLMASRRLKVDSSAGAPS